MTGLVVSIINYRTGAMTCRAAASALDALEDRADAALVIVDNASGDGSAEEIADWLAARGDARARLVRSPTNTGFSGGHNQTFAALPDATAYLLLNSDAILRAGFFAPLEAAMTAYPRAGLIAPRLEWEDGTPQESAFRFHGALSEMNRAAATGPLSRLLARHIVALPLPPDPEAIEWASFACILARGEMVREIGPMDEGYFLYFEDAEYALRARRAGWRTIQVPDAVAVHYRGGSGPVKAQEAAKKRLPPYYWRARTRFMRQAHGPLGPTLANLGWIAGRAVAQARRVTGRGVPRVTEAEWRDIWMGWRNPLTPIGRNG